MPVYLDRWLFSTNAKDIGTLYLIFGVFSGMIMLDLNIVYCYKNIIFSNYFNINYKVKLFDNKLLLILILNLVLKLKRHVYKIAILFKNIFRDFIQNYINYNKIYIIIFLFIYNYLLKMKVNKILVCLFIFLFIDYLNFIEISSDCTYLFVSLFLNNKNKNYNINSYLAGLIESDGAIMVSLDQSKHTPTISIVFNIKDLPLAKYIITKLGYGSIQKSLSKNAIKLVIRNKKGIVHLVSLINGYFRTPKISALNILIDWINARPSYSNLISYKLQKLPLDISNLNTNAWLSGFSDGDASFQIRVTKGKKYNIISVTYELSQSRINIESLELYRPIMELISKLCLSKVTAIHLSKFDRTGTQMGLRVRNTNISGAINIKEYFDKFPLFSSKYLDFLCWSEALQLILDKVHLNKENNSGIIKLENLKNSMNNKRTYFNWDHLTNFYK